ncbi:MAG: HNH endonuclease family protein [Candidatus Saccharibacteria bacterium GW2011_GWA2_46_10]|nr:MAG: HNH endonuclease family protein [Candidatus Saccharibacteria bacterium GW2011_GWA2_46_10]
MARKSHWRSSLVALKLATRLDLIISQEGRCAYCSRMADPSRMTVDHVWPKSHGGQPFEDRNLVLACEDCNQKKGDSDPREFVGLSPDDAPIFKLHPELRPN